ncbi:MAG TPA: hypothetical protein VFB59_02860 [Candidatus Saccharimonadales bacterium]|nr:hypothetical protein [Candidatus Saccharimonadales bacterium]
MTPEESRLIGDESRKFARLLNTRYAKINAARTERVRDLRKAYRENPDMPVEEVEEKQPTKGFTLFSKIRKAK